MKTSDRRRHPRFAANFLVQHLEDVGQPHQIDYAADLSMGGLFIKTRNPAPLDASIQVQFAPGSDGRMVQAFCRVARVTPEGMGAQFIQLDGESASLLAHRCEA